MDSQDEEMDTASLQVPHSLFMIDKRPGEGGDGTREQGDGEERWNEGEVEEDGALEEDTNCPANMEEEEDDDEVSITRKASVRGQREEKGQNGKENGNHHSGSEESSGEEDRGDQTG